MKSREWRSKFMKWGPEYKKWNPESSECLSGPYPVDKSVRVRKTWANKMLEKNL